VSHDKIGPREAQLRLLREQKMAERSVKKPSASALREKVAKIKSDVKPTKKRKGR
jgi:hypothetical protein